MKRSVFIAAQESILSVIEHGWISNSSGQKRAQEAHGVENQKEFLEAISRITHTLAYLTAEEVLERWGEVDEMIEEDP